METTNKTPRRAKRGVGEPFIWVTAVGLSLGMLMVVGLLALILVNGTAVFWPDRVEQVNIRAESPFELRGKKVFAGRLVKKQDRILQDIEAREAAERAGVWPQEFQYFVGNKDAYGLSFFYIDGAAIAAREQPRDIAQLERLEYGDAFGYFVGLRLKDGATIPAGDPNFLPQLRALNREVNERREELSRIEKGQIGRINHQLQRLALRQKEAGNDAAALAPIEAERQELQTRYETLAKTAGELRARQSENQLVYRLPAGDERTLPLGQLIDFRFPNQLGFFERTSVFLHGIWKFLSEEPREANTEGGVFPAIFGTFVMTLLMSIAVTPFGILAAIYLREYAKQGVFVRSVRIAVNNLAGVPSIVFGVFGLGFFVYFVGGTIDSLFYSASLPTPTFGTGGILWASLTLALMTVPVVIVATEEALSSISRGMREASLACGASKWQTMQRIVLPAAVPGILTGLILAMARGAGEVAPLMLVGVVKLAPNLPLDMTFPFFHLERKFMHLGFHIYDLGFQSPDSEAAKPMVFATTALLIGLVIVLNLGAILLRERLRRKYALGAF
ncbi:MAG: phosphate ABC transporter permease PstA [Chthoniobacterales bacterium]|nr:phosphate ABC transporter permease PstA [Chthoniobacterales bacterium]